MAKDVSRTSYTRRIMEIVANIQRQKEDIGKVLQDMRMVQKEINSLTGRLERVFTVTDEQVYKGARKDEARRAAYKLLANIRGVCSSICECDSLPVSSSIMYVSDVPRHFVSSSYFESSISI